MNLRFDFHGYAYDFSDPVHIVQTCQLDKVISSVQEVEEWVKKGFYAAGFISYEAAPAFRSYLTTRPAGEFPLLWFGIFKKPIDRKEAAKSVPASSLSHDPAQMVWHPDCSWAEYQQAIATIHDHIAAGDSYQVNHTIRMHADFPLDPYGFYLHLLNAQQSRYSAYLDIGEYQILSASPELFFEIQDGIITTRPMKGTAPRGLTPSQDQQNRQRLNSEKNQAENLMIVDLLRNDLGQVARQGTVRVTSLFDQEKYPTVWQLTSEIKAELQDHVPFTDILRALFPCGSITGAPKVSTMRIIADLEKQPRGIYCGALGMITPDQKAVFSVPIRTLTLHRQKAVYGVGGGITWDSSSQDEYDEVTHKIQVLYDCRLPEQLLESFLLEKGTYFLLDLHLRRLKDSADYFGFIYPAGQIMDRLRHIADLNPEGTWKVRLLVNQQGKIQVDVQAVQPLFPVLMARWAPLPIKRHNVFLYHKTTRRDFYPKAELNYETLLYNEDGEVTEFVNGNFLLYKEGKWITPPVSSGLLNGTMRASLLRQGKIHEAVIMKKDIVTGCRMAFINSVRKWRVVEWQETSDPS